MVSKVSKKKCSQKQQSVKNIFEFSDGEEFEYQDWGVKILKTADEYFGAKARQVKVVVALVKKRCHSDICAHIGNLTPAFEPYFIGVSEHAQSPKKKFRTFSGVVLVGFDTEFFEENFSKSVPKSKTYRATKKRVLTYQYAIPVSEGLWYSVVLAPVDNRPISSRFCLHTLFKYAPIDPEADLNIISHYSSADLTSYSDYKSILRRCLSIRGSFIDSRPRSLNIRDLGKPLVHARIRHLDTYTLAPAGKASLDAIMRVLGLSKVLLPADCDKSKMNEVILKYPREFFVYSIVDAIGSVEYWRTFHEEARKITGDPEGIYLTTPSFGIEVIVKNTEGDDDTEKISKITGLRPNYVRIGKYTKVIWQPRVRWTDFLNECRETYQGGRNETFYHGIFNEEVFDVDLKSAYTIAMSCLEEIDWDSKPILKVKEKISLSDIPDPFAVGCFVGDFEFPSDTVYPCLPCVDPEGRGLIYPLCGFTRATLPEVFVALLLGAKLSGKLTYAPTKKGRYIFREAMEKIISQRKLMKEMFGKGSFKELLFKEAGNSGYGKLGQGLTGKRTFNPRKGCSEEIPESKVTAPHYAATITGICRALVSISMANLLKSRGIRTLAVTTDGFLIERSGFSKKKIVKILNESVPDEMRSKLEPVLKKLTGSEDLFEVKHDGKSALVIKTRNYATFRGRENLVAHAGLSKKSRVYQELLEECGGKREEVLKTIYENRFKYLVNQKETCLPSPRDIILKNYTTSKVIERVYKPDYDFKRFPDFTSISKKPFGFWTLPFQTFDEFVKCRGYLDLYRKRVSSKGKIFIASSYDHIIQFLLSMKIPLKSQHAQFRETLATYFLHLIGAGIVRVKGKMKYRDIVKAVNKIFKTDYQVDILKNLKRKSRQPYLAREVVPVFPKSLKKKLERNFYVPAGLFSNYDFSIETTFPVVGVSNFQ